MVALFLFLKGMTGALATFLLSSYSIFKLKIWQECWSNVGRNESDMTYINFFMLVGPFKQIELGGGGGDANVDE
jgi:hypothetical protein